MVQNKASFYLVLFGLKNYNEIAGGMRMDDMSLKGQARNGVAPRGANYSCAAGRIPGAVKIAEIWVISKDAEKPVDRRCKKK